MKHEYKNFRATGVAFSPEENENHEAPNRSLSSSKVMGDGRGDKNAYRGYWVGIEMKQEIMKLLGRCRRGPIHNPRC